MDCNKVKILPIKYPILYSFHLPLLVFKMGFDDLIFLVFDLVEFIVAYEFFCGRGSFGRFKTTSLRKSACSRQDIAIRSRSSLLVAITSQSNIAVIAIFWPFTEQSKNKYFQKDVFYRKHLELFNILVISLSRVSV